MNLVFSTTGFQGFNSTNYVINEANVGDWKIPDGEIDSIFIDMCFHLVQVPKIIEILNDIYMKMKPEGILKISCSDIYQIAHKMHRRDIDEGYMNTIMYSAGQKNCLSSLFFVQTCLEIGFKKKFVGFNDVVVQLEFVK